MEDQKILGEKRRKYILHWLQEATLPTPANELARRANVSRQVIVQDVSLLKAKGFPIISTSQGYIIQKKVETPVYSRVIACQHGPEDLLNELQLIVDCGVLVKNVIVEHSVYGEIAASVMVKNRLDVDNFLRKMRETNASMLSELTDGIHLHTLEAENEEQIEQAILALDEAGLLLKEQ